MLEPAFIQPLQNRSLGCLTLTLERIMHVTTLFVLCRQSRRSAQVGLISKHHEKFCLLAVSRMFHDPRRNLACARRPFRRTSLTDGARADGPQGCDGSCPNEQ